MTKQCPNCSKEFVESREKAFEYNGVSKINSTFRCADCGWFKNVDGKWYSCPEPHKVTEPDLPKAPKAPAEPQVPKDDNVRLYMGGLVTVTTIEDDDNEEIN